MGECFCKSWALVFCPTDAISVDLLAFCFCEGITLEIKVLILGGDSCVSDEHRVGILQDSQLPALLLFLPLEVESQHCLIHHPCHQKHLLNLLLFRDSPQFIMQGNSNF